jgi:aspartyl-tRNA(Asn)/glutamyl-tRNA(Gln) amidotransferase subunit B
MTSTPSTYSLICGLEVHAELKTASKMFCGCKNDPFHAEAPNTHTCPVCLGMPGGLPVANQKAIEWTIKLGLALGCKINLFSKFDRKHYFYPDLPKGYQISQYDLPFCYEGQVMTSFGPVRIRRIHLEEDTGKLQHKTVNGRKVSLIDFNRSSVPLVEIVTEPDITSAAQAKEYGKKIRQILRYLGFADCDMEQGGMRLEANISLSPNPQAVAQDDLPEYKVEVKNINSFRFLEQAIEFESQRQSLILMDGGVPKQETRGWDTTQNTTFPQRTKEDAEDYRYFPDPDLPPIHFEAATIEGWRSELPELPEAVAARWTKSYGIDSKYASILIEDRQQTAELDAVFSLALDQKIEANKIANFLVNKRINFVAGQSPEQLLKSFSDLATMEAIDTTELTPIIESVIIEFPDEVAAYKAGKTPLINFLVGQTIKKIGKKVDVAQVRSVLAAKLG